MMSVLPEPGCECGVCEGVTEVLDVEKSAGGGLYLNSAAATPSAAAAAAAAADLTLSSAPGASPKYLEAS